MANWWLVNQGRQKRFPRVLFCLALSLLLHALLGLLILLIPPQEKVKRAKAVRKGRPVKVVRTAARKKADEKKVQQQAAPREETKTPAEQKPFAKTSAETPQALPDQPDYEGKRSTRAASAPDARHRASAEHAPAMDGKEKEELVTFDQQRQEGDLEHEGKTTLPTPPVPPSPLPQPAPPAPPSEAPAEGQADGADSPDTTGKDAETTIVDATNSLTLTDDLSGQLKLRQEDQAAPIPEPEQQAARKGAPGGTGKADSPRAQPRRPHVFYDPSLAEWARKPGFRTNERRSRSSGRFVLGRGAALNVASTPRGAYEAMIYRRVAHFWYIACDEHRGDIIPGKITISLRISKRGQIDSMALIKRSGASISQQSFTFKAIRKASLPPMPPEVQADVIGDLMELIFEFNFD